MTERIEIENDNLSKLFGSFDANIKRIEAQFDARISTRDGAVLVDGQDAAACRALLEQLIALLEQGYEIDGARIDAGIELVKDGRADELLSLTKSVVYTTARGRQIGCKTVGQRDYVRAVKSHTLTFGVGPAGTGKTFLAVALAAAAFKAGEVEKIILTRPAIEAGEKLGFLPGDLKEKVDPYLRPLYDALGEMFGVEAYERLLERGSIEVAPLAYMRGRTLARAFVILDEAQNATNEQMKMFLTRLGEGSRMVVNGDDSQIDLPHGTESGLKIAVDVLKGIDDVALVRLSERDVVRHALITRIVRAYAASGR